jgi:DNA-binding HxlR family transcriptional regulator
MESETIAGNTALAADACDGAGCLIGDNPRVDALVRELIGQIADKWTMIILEVLAEHGELRFTRLGELTGNISQKMLTQTLRQMERDGLVVRTVHPVIPPRVEYRLTELGLGLGASFCGVWTWATEHITSVEAARLRFDSEVSAPKASAAIRSP